MARNTFTVTVEVTAEGAPTGYSSDTLAIRDMVFSVIDDESGLDAVAKQVFAGTASGYTWQDVRTMGGDELRSLDAAELARLLADALEAGDGDAAERVTYYLEVKRYGEDVALAMARAREL